MYQEGVNIQTTNGHSYYVLKTHYTNVNTVISHYDSWTR